VTADPRLGLGRYLHRDATAAYAAALVRQLSGDQALPTYGTPKWLRASREVQLAAAVIAADAHRIEQLYRPQALEDELAAARHLAHLDDQAEFARIAAGVRAMGSGGHADHAELRRRREEPSRPRPHAPTPWHPLALTHPDAAPADRWCWRSEPDPTCPCRWCREYPSPTAQEDVA
jgi:hypothetical protein